MTIEEKVKDLIITKYKSVRKFTQYADMPYTTLNTMFKRGITNSTLSNVLKLCEALQISADDLAEGRIVPVGEAVPKNSITDVDTILAYTRRNVQEYTDLTIGGEALTQSELEVLLDALEVAVQIIKRHRGRNYRSEN